MPGIPHKRFNPHEKKAGTIIIIPIVNMRKSGLKKESDLLGPLNIHTHIPVCIHVCTHTHTHTQYLIQYLVPEVQWVIPKCSPNRSEWMKNGHPLSQM